MLHITDNYYAQANNYGYTVLLKSEKKGKDNQDIHTTLGYVGSLQEVLALVLKDSVQKKISGEDIELGEALQFVRNQADKISSAMAGINV